MKMEMEVEYLDGTVKEILVIPVDMIAFEREHKKGIGKVLSEDQKLTDLCWLGWHVCRRTKATDLDFDPWTENVASISAVDKTDEGKAADAPLVPAP